jgi:hypothetical protein
MNRMLRSICFLLAAALAGGWAQPSASEARAAMNEVSIDCSKADAMIIHPSGSMKAMTASGDLDKDYVHLMMMENSAMMAMTKTEIACGKDQITKATARKMLGRATGDDRSLRQLLGGGA